MGLLYTFDEAVSLMKSGAVFIVDDGNFRKMAEIMEEVLPNKEFEEYKYYRYNPKWEYFARAKFKKDFSETFISGATFISLSTVANRGIDRVGSLTMGQIILLLQIHKKLHFFRVGTYQENIDRLIWLNIVVLNDNSFILTPSGEAYVKGLLLTQVQENLGTQYVAWEENLIKEIQENTGFSMEHIRSVIQENEFYISGAFRRGLNTTQTCYGLQVK